MPAGLRVTGSSLAAVLSSCVRTDLHLSWCSNIDIDTTSWNLSAGDMLTKAFPNSGRIIAAQFSVLMTFPCTMVIYKCLPVTASGGMDTMTLPYAAVFFFTGLLISWYGPPHGQDCCCVEQSL